MARRFKAVFFDRDQTLCGNSPAWQAARNRAFAESTGIPDFRLTDELNMQVFWEVLKTPGAQRVNTLELEDAFWRKWYEGILQRCGVREHVPELAAELRRRFCFHKMMELYPETRRVLKTLKARRYKLGVISDTFPSLKESLKALGIARFFGSFTASSIVGVGKPHPMIFGAAMAALKVSASQSLFVDDCKEEVDGAREQGFTALHLDRSRRDADFATWTISNLDDVLKFLDQPA